MKIINTMARSYSCGPVLLVPGDNDVDDNKAAIFLEQKGVKARLVAGDIIAEPVAEPKTAAKTAKATKAALPGA